MIAFEGVGVRYPHASGAALENVSLAARAGALTAVVGPNGSGKSTLVRALLGRAPVTQGRILVDGIDRARLGVRGVARRVAVVTQGEESFFHRPVRDYIALGLLPHAPRFRRDERNVGPASDAVADGALRAGVSQLLDRRTDELSGGEWQRVRIARALTQRAATLVLDEPTASLDVGHEMQVFELLSRLAGNGATVLLVSHQLNLVARFAARMVLLDRGCIAAAGPPDAVMRGEILERVYGWPLVVTRDPAVGAPALVPMRRGS